MVSKIGIMYNGVFAEYKMIDGIKCLALEDLVKLTGRARSYVYTVYNRQKVDKYNMTPHKKRDRVINLTGCVLLLSRLYNPDKKLIAILTEANDTPVVKVAGSSWEIGQKHFNFAPVDYTPIIKQYEQKFEAIEKKFDSFVSDIVPSINNIAKRVRELEGKQTINQGGNSNNLRDLLKECIIDMLRDED